MNDLLPFAKKMLAEHGEFHPYGGYTSSDGSIVHVGAIDPATDHPRGADLLEFLREDFRRRATEGSIQAAAIVLNVRVKPPNREAKSDAIEVLVEHRDAYCAEVFFPYYLQNGGAVEYGPVFAQRGEGTIFGGAGSGSQN